MGYPSYDQHYYNPHMHPYPSMPAPYVPSPTGQENAHPMINRMSIPYPTMQQLPKQEGAAQMNPIISHPMPYPPYPFMPMNPTGHPMEHAYHMDPYYPHPDAMSERKQIEPKRHAVNSHLNFIFI